MGLDTSHDCWNGAYSAFHRWRIKITPAAFINGRIFQKRRQLEKLIPLLPEEEAGGHIGIWKNKTQKFVDGLRLAYSKKENVEFY